MIEVIMAIYQAMIIREGRYRLVHIDRCVNAFQNDKHEGQTLSTCNCVCRWGKEGWGCRWVFDYISSTVAFDTMSSDGCG